MNNKLKSISFSALLALAFSLVFYTFNTPLGASIGSDNAIYLTMGTALTQGYAPYTEIFDHKGPLLFLLQALPQALSGGYSTLAVFIQQTLFLFACLRVIVSIAKELNVRGFLIPQLVYLALICAHVGGGNLTEEYTNLFTLLGFLLIVRYFGPKTNAWEARSLFLPAAALGMLAMLCFLTRANNALPLAGAVFSLSLWLAVSGKLKPLGVAALGFAAGCVAIALPVILWLISCGALEEAFYGSIIHNMMYAETNGASRLAMLLTSSYGHSAILMAVLACMGALVSFIRTREIALPAAMVFSAATGGLAAFISHKFYAHYLILSAPAAVLGVCIILSTLNTIGRRQLRAAGFACLAVCFGWLSTKGMQINNQRLSDHSDLQQFTENAQALYALVPESERDRFMAYRVEPKWYVCAEALPCMRFYFLQEILADADPAVMEEIVAEFKQDPPKWLVIYYNRPFYPPYDARIEEIFNTQYEFVNAKGQYQLLRLIDDESRNSAG